MRKIIIISGFFILGVMACSNLYAQPLPAWIQRYNGLLDSTDVAVDITVDSAGNSYVTGYSRILGLLTNIVTIRYDSDGTERWSAAYGGLLWDEGAAIILDNTQQFVYVTGFTTNLLPLTFADYVIIKYDALTGNQIWVRTYNNGLLGDDRATSIAVDGQNNPVITGYSEDLILLSNYDYATIKYDQNGIQQWVRRYNGSGNNEDRANAIAVDNSNNVFVTGYTRNGLLGGNYDYATIKYNSAGTQQWVSIYNGPGGNNIDKSYAIVVDNSGEIIVTGESQSSSSPNSEDYATVKYNTNGNQQWVSRYNGPGNGEDKSYAIVVDNSDNVIVTGESVGSGTDIDYATVKYDSAGVQQWPAARYNGPGNNEDKSYAIVVDNSDNIYVTGSSRSGSSAGTEDYATVKYNSSGTQQWAARYDGTGNNEDKSYAIVVDNSDNVYVTGSSRNGPLLGSEDYLTIKYPGKGNAVQIISNEIPVKNSIAQNYPNPFNPSTNISFDLMEQTFINISIYDIRGNKIAVIVNQKLNPGKYAVEWNAANFPSGVYFYRVVTKNFSQTNKMILIK